MFRASLRLAQIQRGASLPTLPLKHQNPGDVVHLAQLASKGRHILVTVPGAFTPSCSSQVPEFLSSLPRFAARDVLSINVLAVNDAFVTSAWGKSMLPHAESAAPIVRFLADDTGAFSDALGLLFDATGGLGNQRAKRAALVIEDGRITSVAVENVPSEVTVSSAEAVLKALE